MADDLVQTVVAARRLASGAAPIRSFTIERTEARLRLRTRPGNRPWSWTLALVRAALVVAHEPTITVACVREGELDVWSFVLSLPGADLVELDLTGLLDVAVEPDPGAGRPIPVRVRRLLARALNEALAAEPAWIELVTPFAGRRCERRTAHGARDPYDERAIATRTEPGLAVVRLALPPRGLGRVVDALRDGLGEVLSTLRTQWTAAIPWGALADRGSPTFALRQPLPGGAVELGSFARWWPQPRQVEVALVRDGLRIAQLDAALGRAGLPSAMLRGYIECDALQLTADEGAIVEDAAFAELVAWLGDALAHSTARADGASWPTWPDPPRLVTVSGDPLSAAALDQLGADAREVLFALPPERDRVPESLRTRVLLLWPSEQAWVRRCYPTIRLVPVRGVLAANQVGRTDLTALAQGSFPARSLAIEPWVHGDAPPLPVEVVALVHAHGVADKGAVVMLAWERSLGRLADESIVIPGVTLVARISDATRVDELRDDASALRSFAIHVAGEAKRAVSELVQHALTHGGSDAVHRVPLLRAEIAGLSARTLALRYEGAPARLRWRADPLLGFVVAHARDGTAVPLATALARARDVGGLVVGDATRRWFTLEDESLDHATWIPTSQGSELLSRMLGRAALWEMPVVPQGMPHATPAVEQRALLLDAQEVARLLLRATTDPLARTRLLGHLLVARAVGEPEQGLADVALLSTYDPRAVEPVRLRSVAAVQADGRRFAVVPIGTGSRELVGPVVEAAPGEAALLVEVLSLSTTPTADGTASTSAATATAQRRPAAVREPVVSIAIADPLAVGALHLHAEPSAAGIEIWAKGLRVGAVVLPAPLAEVAGKLWLSDDGIRARHEGIEAIAAREGRQLVAAALRQVALAPPGSPRRRALERFVAHCRAALVDGRDRFGLRQMLDAATPPVVLGADQATAAKLPPLRRLWLPTIVRHALGRTTSIETTWLSWRAAKLVDARAPTWTVELGSRHRWNKRALAEDASIVDVFLAACVAVTDVLAQAEVPPSALAAALLRVLATAHAGPRS
jgi:hypothetical protein